MQIFPREGKNVLLLDSDIYQEAEEISKSQNYIIYVPMHNYHPRGK